MIQRYGVGNKLYSGAEPQSYDSRGKWINTHMAMLLYRCLSATVHQPITQTLLGTSMIIIYKNVYSWIIFSALKNNESLTRNK